MTLALTGSAHWHGAADAAASLAGKLDQADTGQYDISLTLTPADQNNPLLLALKLDGPDNHADLRLPPLALAHWWSELGDRKAPQLTRAAGQRPRRDREDRSRRHQRRRPEHPSPATTCLRPPARRPRPRRNLPSRKQP